MAGSRQIVRNLNRLAQHETDLIEAYSRAIECVESVQIRHRLSEIRSDHERHIHAIGVHVTRQGGPRLRIPGLLRMVLRAQISLVSRVGGDNAVLRVLRLWKGLTILRYRVALRWGGFTPEIRQVISKNLEDELRQYAWLSENTSSAQGDVPS